MKDVADTGFIVAFLNRRDGHRRWSVELAQAVSEPLITYEGVLAEAAFHLGSVPARSGPDTGLIAVNFDFNSSYKHIEQLGRKYWDRSPDLVGEDDKWGPTNGVNNSGKYSPTFGTGTVLPQI